MRGARPSRSRRDFDSVTGIESRRESVLESVRETVLTITSIPAVETAMLRDPLRRCVGIAVLLVGFTGLLALGGAGWSVDAAVADGSSGAEEIALLEGTNFDLGAEYRSPRLTAAEDDVVTVATGIVDTAGLVNVLVAPAGRRSAPASGGLLYVHAISTVAAAMVAGRVLVGWRFDLRGLALEPRGNRRVGHRSDPDRRPALRADGGSRREE